MHSQNRHYVRYSLSALALVGMTACGGGSRSPPTYSIGGTISGIDAGQSVVLKDNGGDDLTVSANGTFTFASKISRGGAYVVTATAAAGKTCTVTGGSGTASASVTSVAVACHSNPTFSIGGTVSGLDAGQSIVLQDNGADSLTVSANGAFTFATKVASGLPYAVSVHVQPQGKYCTVTGGSGTVSGNLTSVAVACSGPYTVGGAVSGLVGQGLELSLQANVRGTPIPNRLQISGNGPYVFPTALYPSVFGQVVAVAQQPHSPVQRCIVQNAYFTKTPTNDSDISNVNVLCGEFSIVANSAADTLSTYLIDASSGAFASLGPPVAVDSSPTAIAGTIDKKYLYVSNGGGNDVSAFTVDAGSGALTTVPGSPFAAGTDPKAVSVYTTGVGTDRGQAWFLFYLYVANAGSNNVSAYQIDQTTGVLQPLSPSAYATGPGPSALAVHPSGFLYTANSAGSNDISAFLIDEAGTLSPIAGSPFASGSNVSSLAFGAGGSFLYAANASGAAAAIFGFSVHPYDGGANEGALTPLTGLPHALPSCSSIVTDQTGAFLYATAGTNVFGFGIDKQSGALSSLPGFPLAVGANADSITIDPSNQFFYVRNRTAGMVTGFSLNAATGALAPLPASPITVGASAVFIATF